MNRALDDLLFEPAMIPSVCVIDRLLCRFIVMNTLEPIGDH